MMCLPGAALARTTPGASQRGASADTIVRVAQQPLHPGVATLKEELSIGVADGAEEYMLGEIADIALARDGSIYVFDRQVPAIRHYDTQGKFLRTIGRRGQGPGEYHSASGLAALRDGRLLLWDTGNWRINVYAANGDVLTNGPRPAAWGGGTAMYSRAIMVDMSIGHHAQDDSRHSNGMNRPTVWLRYRPDGTPLTRFMRRPRHA
jgi:hypothetical protein